MKIAMCRILGNDLPGRHHPEQTLRNTKFILEKEPQFPDVTKTFILNRIVDQTKVEKLVEMIEKAGCPWIGLPFSLEDFRSKKTYEEAAKYVTNLNPARNYCIDTHLDQGFDLVLPLDGATFFRTDGWVPFITTVETYPEDGVYAVPVARVNFFDEVLVPSFQAQIREKYVMVKEMVYGMREMYLAFNKNADVRFNQDLMYGKVDKVELMWRLGMAGPWDKWEPQIRREALKKPSKLYGSVKIQGYSIRLPSHEPSGDGDNLVRGRARAAGLKRLVDALQSY